MGTKKLETLIDEYGTLQAAASAQAAAYAADRAALLDRIDPTIREALERLEANEHTAMAALHAELSELATTIKRAVTPLGHSVKATTMQAVYSPGRPLWNDAMLQGYAMGHPEILDARSVGEPSVSLRPLKREGAKECTSVRS